VFPLVGHRAPQHPLIVGIATNIVTSGTTVTFDLPDHEDGDILVTHAYRLSNSMGVPTGPSGWTEEMAGADHGGHQRGWFKEASSEGATASFSVPSAVSAASPALVITVAIRYAASSVDFQTVTNDLETATTTHTITSITQVANVALCFYAYFLERQDGNALAQPTPPNGSTLTAFVRGTDVSADNRPMVVYHQLRYVSGAVGAKVVTSESSSDSLMWMWGFAAA